MAYAEVEELKEWMSLDVEDYSLDVQLVALLDAATEAIDEHCDRSFSLTEASARTVTQERGPIVFTDDYTTLVGVTTLEGSPVEAAAMPSTPPRGRPHTSVLVASRPICRPLVVTATWGWATIPESIHLATMMTASRYWERRSSPFGVMGTVDTGVIRITGQDRDVQAILAPYVRASGRLA